MPLYGCFYLNVDELFDQIRFETDASLSKGDEVLDMNNIWEQLDEERLQYKEKYFKEKGIRLTEAQMKDVKGL